MPVALIAAGSNLGDRHEYLASAMAALRADANFRVIGSTPPERTAPLGGLDQPDYLNQMHAVETSLGPE
ncbi:MAG: 2-amino-4-hydroxy-6-hydroxymethyldihydropteridine diphosphokinase, partial [Gemmatimonadales bacterium]